MKHFSKFPLKIVAGIVGILLFTSCGDAIKKGDQLTAEDIRYIHDMGILDDGEAILLFDSQGSLGGKRSSGNFITEKRIATYWIDDHDIKLNVVESAFYPDIDTIITKDLSSSLTYASYLEVHTKDKRVFKVNVDAKEAELQKFFDLANEKWRKNRGPRP
ncbi:MAG TPA: hypothetical protein PL185_12655 [Flavobacteriales bacterium]|jgi:hypothetical protein|nr:hypothetical protein [Flavobacteriales bacterium]HPH83423.1 hypothetical protein [Flavobacteriales bacterium]